MRKIDTEILADLSLDISRERNALPTVFCLDWHGPRHLLLVLLDIKIGQLLHDDAARLKGFLGDAGCMRDAADATQQPEVPSSEPLAAFRADSPFSV